MERQTPVQGRGRPTKYKPEFADLLIEHFEEYLREPERQVLIGLKKFYRKDGSHSEEYVYKPVPKPIPTLFDFSRKIGVSYDTVLNWPTARVGDEPESGQPDKRPHKYPEFFQSYKQVIHFQTKCFMTVGLGGTAPSAFAIFAAKNMIRWRDDQYVGALGKKGQPITPGGYVLIPNRLTDTEAKQEYDEQQQDASVTAS